LADEPSLSLSSRAVREKPGSKCTFVRTQCVALRKLHSDPFFTIQGGAYGGGVSFAGGFGSSTTGPVSGHSKGGTTFIVYSDGTVEVRAGGDPNWRNNNPGNLRPDSRPGASVDAIAQIFGAVGVTQSDFFIFGTGEGGWMALVGVLGTPGNQAKSIGDLIRSYAPFNDKNNPAAYAATIQQLTGFAPTTIVGALDGPELLQLAATISRIEGTRRGTVTVQNP
jgi:hypothetical protein